MEPTVRYNNYSLHIQQWPQPSEANDTSQAPLTSCSSFFILRPCQHAIALIKQIAGLPVGQPLQTLNQGLTGCRFEVQQDGDRQAQQQ
jgi:hypothetical protein